MKVISTLPEVQKHLPVNYTGDFERIDPFIASAEYNYLKLVIGKAQFDILAAEYLDAGKDLENVADADVREALYLAQKVVVNLGYLVGIPTLSLSVGSNGIQVFSNQDTKQAFKWQVDDFKVSLRELGYDALEQLLIHLEESPDKFPAYMDSDQYRKNEQFLIQTAGDFSDNFNIGGSRYTFSLIAYIMKRIEDQTVKPVFGSEFFESLKLGNLPDKSQYLADNFLKPGIALLTGAKAVIERIITYKNGVASVNLEGNSDEQISSTAPSALQVKEMYDQLQSDGAQFLKDGMEYLVTNIEDFPDYVPVVAKRRYNSPSDKTKGVFMP